MAGHRRERGQPTRAQRREAALQRRMAAASTPSGRIAAAADYARAVVAGMEPADASRAADEITRVLTETARQAERRQR